MAQDYIHGYSREEQRRLIQQAEVLAPNVFAGLDLTGPGRLLEIGCGVGAELATIAARWPRPDLIGLDRSAEHLAAAKDYLLPLARAGRAWLLRGDAYALPFRDGSLDTVITVWMLEHVAGPDRVLAEALRTLAPGGRLVCTEVDNGSFAFDPAVPAIRDWWDAFNRFQLMGGGDPFVGRRLAHLATESGYADIDTKTLPIIASDREPRRRGALLDYLENLLLSGADHMLAAGIVRQTQVAALRRAFEQVRGDETTSFRYFAVRLTCRKPPG
jgi:ubiquinone/menaquinone biosynthesis C-methylase UbiE